MNIIEFISTYWDIIVVVIIVGTGFGIFLHNFSKMSKGEKIKCVKKWLLYAVKCAEDEFGSKTGQIKLGFVYDLFVKRFPSVARFISFDTFCIYVDEALEELKEMFKDKEKEENE